MKLGLFKLSRAKEIADDWVWIADHVLSRGPYKCFAVMGVRMKQLRERGDLTVRFEDLEPLGIVPMRKSNGPLVELELEEILEKTGNVPPLAILKDQGSDLRCGGRRFCEAHPGVIDLHDVPHKVARLYGDLLTDDEQWISYTRQCAEAKRQMQFTELAHLAPPNQRAKARFHNIDVITTWGLKQLPLSDNYDKLQWLKAYEKPLAEWSQLVEVGKITRDLIRKEGLSRRSYEILSNRLLEVTHSSRAESLACDLIDFLEIEGGKIPEGQSVIASSEILESLFGLYKTIADRGPTPMRRCLLSLASRVGPPPSEELITTAFESIHEAQVDEWLQKSFT